MTRHLLCLSILAGCNVIPYPRGDFAIRAIDDDGDSIRGHRLTVQCDSLLREPVIVQTPTALVIECWKPTSDGGAR